MMNGRRLTSGIYLALVLLMPAARVGADAGDPRVQARAILDQVLVNRPAADLALKARLWAGRDDEPVPVEILVKNLPREIRTLYRLGGTEALIVQPTEAPARYYVRGQGELTGAARLHPLAGSRFTLYDVGLPFLHWADATYLGEDRTRGRTCHHLEVKATDEPYPTVRLWIDKEYHALLRAEALNENGDPIRRFAVTSFRRLGQVWVPRGMELAFVPPGQSLPAEEKSRLEVYTGDYDARLPDEWFADTKFR